MIDPFDQRRQLGEDVGMIGAERPTEMAVDYIVTGVYLLAAFQGLVLLVGLMATGRTSSRANKFLAVLVLLITIFVGRKIIHTSGFAHARPFMLGSFYPLIYTFGPLFYFYARDLAGRKPLSALALGVHFIPMLWMYIINMPVIISAERKAHYSQAVLTDPSYVIKPDELHALLLGSSGWIHFAIYCVVIIGIWEEHRRKIKNEFTSLEMKNLTWLRGVAILGLVSGIIAFGLVWGSLLQGLPLMNNGTRFIEILLVLLLFFLSYAGYAQPAIFAPADRELARLDKAAHSTLGENFAAKRQNFSPSNLSSGNLSSGNQQEPAIGPNAPSLAKAPSPTKPLMGAQPGDAVDGEKYGKSSLTDGAADIYARQLKNAMSEQELFLDNNLTLTSLSEHLNIPHHHLSQVINSAFDANFFEFVNSYRVEYAKKLLTSPDHKHVTILNIALSAGFNNKTSFYRSFKAATGVTPSKFKSQK